MNAASQQLINTRQLMAIFAKPVGFIRPVVNIGGGVQCVPLPIIKAPSSL